MSTVTHTPEPWRAVLVKPEDHRFPYVVIPHVSPEIWTDLEARDRHSRIVMNSGGWPLDVQNENAKLVARAPAMLKMTKTVYKLALLADETHQGSELNDAILAQCVRVLTEDEIAEITRIVFQELGR